jgi:hypothetical protein
MPTGAGRAPPAIMQLEIEREAVKMKRSDQGRSDAEEGESGEA